MFKILPIFFLALLFNACSLKDYSINNDTKHTMRSDKLKVLMHNMDMIIYDNGKSELDRDNERRRNALKIGNRIQDISSQIKNLDSKDEKLFTFYIKELHRKGKELSKLANNYEIEKLEIKIQDIKLTCNACHQESRDYYE